VPKILRVTAPTVPPTDPREGPHDGPREDPRPPAEREPSDLGFGRVVVQAARGRFLDHDGTPRARKYGLGAQRLERFYLQALNAGWPGFLGWGLGALLLLNGVFALAYLGLGPAAIAGTDAIGLTDPFLRALAFSVGVFTTTGTTPMYAVGPTAQWLVVFESFVGPTVLVTAGGLLVARLTRPRMRLRFSESAVVAPYEGGRGLMFRMVNAQPGELSDVRVRVNLGWFEDLGGRRERNFHQLALERSSVEFFTLHWTVVHPITAESPLAGITPEALHEAGAEFLILVDAHEETFSTRVTARASYTWDEVTWDAKFASIFTTAADDVIAIDVERLGRLDRLAPGTTSAPAALERLASGV
jgi:inward rectifier potassium channel